MNITNNPLFTCVTNKDNPYLNTMTFKKVKSETDKQEQISIFLNFISYYSLAEPYIFNYSKIYKTILQDVEQNPQRYHRTKQEFEKSAQFIIQATKDIILDFRNRAFKMDLCKCNITIFNDLFCENVLNLNINKFNFVDGMIKVAQSFEQLTK